MSLHFLSNRFCVFHWYEYSTIYVLCLSDQQIHIDQIKRSLSDANGYRGTVSQKTKCFLSYGALKYHSSC